MIKYPSAADIEQFVPAASLGTKKTVRQALLAMPDELMRLGVTTVVMNGKMLLSPIAAAWVRQNGTSLDLKYSTHSGQYERSFSGTKSHATIS